jgi:hypothetical protein
MAVHRRAASKRKSPSHAKARKRRVAKRSKRSAPALAGYVAGLSDLLGAVGGGKLDDCAWELFRLQRFPDLTSEEVAQVLGQWAYENQIWIEFEIRAVRGQDVIFVHFEKLEQT